MPISYAALKAMLDVDEPDYPALAEIAAGAMRHLRKLATATDASLASKAVSLAGIIGDADGTGIVEGASKSRDVLVRVAAAHAASLLPDTPQATRLVSKLLDDKDVGVVKLASRAAGRLSDPGVATKARRANTRIDAAVRAATAQALRQARRTAMSKKAGMTAAGAKARAGKARKGGTRTSASQMPTGAMTEPPKARKARKMPTGEMK
jgi:HEAT repeat protein